MNTPGGTALDLLRGTIRPNSTVGSIARDVFRFFTPRRSRPTLEQILEAFAADHPRATFVQVGSNDAQTGDPLRRFIEERAWRGILTEPVPHVYERLEQRYGGHPRMFLEHAAIADHDGTADFFHIAPSDDPLPWFYDQLGSFSLATVLSHEDEIPDIADRVETLQVRCTTFDTLCRKHSIDHVDLVHIDAEGYDGVILRSIDLATYRPIVLIYEHKHLGAAGRDECIALVDAQGYESLEIGPDTICVSVAALRRPTSRLARAWRVAQRSKAAGAVNSYYADTQ